MKKILSLISVLLVVALFTGCSLLPSTQPMEEKAVPNKAVDLFNYEGVDYLSDQILVRTNGQIDLNTILAKQGSEIVKEWPEIGWNLVTVPADQETLSFIKSLRKLTGVVMAEPNMEYFTPPATRKSTSDAVRSSGENQINTTPTVERYDRQWGFKNMNTEAAWDITTGSEDVIVAIIDTGVDVDHPEFEGKAIAANVDVTDSENGILIDHGTHVAGIAADDGRTGKIAGVAWDCPLLPIKVADDQGSISTTYLIDAMIYLGDYAIDHPDKRIVANMSIGGRGYNFAFKDAIDYAADQGVLLVTSAGNDTKRLPGYPSAYNGVLTVAASTPYDTKADFSTEGPWNSVAAPGVLIYSTVPSQFYEDPYQNMQGTSMASPYVCGGAALLLSEYPNLTPLEIKNQIEQTANGNGYTEELGYGIIDMEAMLGELQPMVYGSLDVTTNVNYEVSTAVITVLDTNESLVGFGTTGALGNYLFHALKPGDYTVTVSFYDPFVDAYEISTQTATVTTGTATTVDFVLDVPVDVTEQVVLEDEFLDGTAEEPNTEAEFPFTIVEAGYYSFVTKQYQDVPGDTVLTLYDSEGTMLANYDSALFDTLDISLTAGDYTLVVSSFDEGVTMQCLLDIIKLTPVYE